MEISLPVTAELTWVGAFSTLILAAALTQVLALVYLWTFQGMSYSRSFVHGLVLGGIVACMLMMAIGNSIAAGIGLAGSLSIVRFRTTLRDPRDMIFVFAALGAGIAAGLHAWTAAVAGVTVFCAAVLMLHAVAYGARYPFDGVVRFVAEGEVAQHVGRALSTHAPEHSLVTLRQAGQGALWEHAYQVRLKDGGDPTALTQALQAIGGVRDVRLYLQEPTQEL